MRQISAGQGRSEGGLEVGRERERRRLIYKRWIGRVAEENGDAAANLRRSGRRNVFPVYARRYVRDHSDPLRRLGAGPGPLSESERHELRGANYRHADIG